MFDIKKEILETHEARLIVEVDEDVVNKAMRQVAREVSKQVSIPGFRRGKVPYNRLVRYVGKDTLIRRSANQLLEDLYPDIIKAAEIEPFAPGDLESYDLSPLVFTLRVPLKPEIALGDYDDLRLDWEEPSVNEEEVDAVLEQVREENIAVEAVERPAQMGDEVHFDVVGTIGEEIIVDEEDIGIPLLEDELFIGPGFVDVLVGLREGEEVDFPYVFPEDFEEEPSLQGAEAVFHVEVTQVYERALPGIDDALANIAGGFETLEEFKADIRERLLEQKLQNAETEYREAMLDALIEQANLRYPPAMIDKTLEGMLQDIEQRYQQQNNMSLEDGLKLAGQTMEQFQLNLRPQAEERLQSNMALGELVRVENITVSDDELVQTYQEWIDSMGLGEQPGMRDLDIRSTMAQNLRSNEMVRKALDLLVQIGRGQAPERITEPEVPEPSEEAEPAAPSPEDEPAPELKDEASAPDEVTA